MVADNEPQVRSEEFQNFAAMNGIQLKFTPPFHPRSNGQAERGLRIFKHALRNFSSA